VRGESFEIVDIRRQHGAAGLRHGNDKSINRRSAPREAAEMGSAPRQRLRAMVNNVASLEKSIRRCVPTCVPLKALDKHGCEHERRPKIHCAKGKNQGDRVS
jgi:hypothetical protein